MQWLRGQQEQGQRFDVSIDQGFNRPAGVVTGKVSEPANLDGTRVAIPWVAFEGSHGDAYSGPVHGKWGNVGKPGDFRVAVLSESDAAYLQGVYPLETDGTWESGEEIARPGRKVAKLVRVSDEGTVAISGGGQTKIEGLEIRLYLRTDVDYLQETVPLHADGTWTSLDRIPGGQTIARLVSFSGRTINTSEWPTALPFEGLVRSFWIPQDDPDYGYGSFRDPQAPDYEFEGIAPSAYQPGYRLEQRSWIYDDALAALAFVQDGEPQRAASILERLREWQAPDGSLPFSLDVYVGQVAENYRRSGALAWVGTAAVEYERATGDAQYRPLATGIANFLLELQVKEPDDPRYGSVLGGAGWYDGDYVFHDGPVDWASTEHNIDAYFFLRDLGLLAGNHRYGEAAILVRQSLLTNHWNPTEGRFNQGVSSGGPDTAKALDLGTWGGLFLLAVGEKAKAESSLAFAEQFRVNNTSIVQSWIADSYNLAYTAPGPISGYRPYLEGVGYDGAPAVVWAEGTWGAILLKERLGLDATADVASMRRMQEADPRGGFVQVTRGARPLPYEFHVWPAVAGTAWAAIVEGDDNILWRPDPPVSKPENAALLQKHAPVLRYAYYEIYFAASAAMATDNYVCCEVVEDSNTLNDSENDIVATADPSLPYDALSLGYLGTRGRAVPTGTDSIDLRGHDSIVEEPEEKLEEDAERMQAELKYADRLYGRVVEEPTGNTLLQYWIFYYDNPKGAEGFYVHEGDWEMVSVRLSPAGTPISASYSQHGDAALCSWGEVEKLGTDKPIVYVAESSHANYFRSGFHKNDKALDMADGEGPQVSQFTIEEISSLSSQSWLLWRGRWGGSDGGTGGSDSPHGPAYQGDSWDDPTAWEDSGDTAEDCEVE
jgi:hypothetical protein